MKKVRLIKKPKKIKKKTRWKLVKELDAIYSLYIRLRDCMKWWRTFCPLCNWYGTYKDAQNMHFITRGCYALRWYDKNCHSGCVRCNVFLNGNYIEYTRWMIERYGLEFVDELRSLRNEVYIIKNPEIEEKIDFYKKTVKALKLNKAIID